MRMLRALGLWMAGARASPGLVLLVPTPSSIPRPTENSIVLKKRWVEASYGDRYPVSSMKPRSGGNGDAARRGSGRRDHPDVERGGDGGGGADRNAKRTSGPTRSLKWTSIVSKTWSPTRATTATRWSSG